MNPLIDAHHHLWTYNQEEYGWIDGTMKLLKRDFLPGELQVETLHAGVSGTVVVQARQTVHETSWLLSIAEANPLIRGVVGWLDLRASDLAHRLEEFASHPKLVGLRHVLQDEPEADFMLQAPFVRGIAQLESHQLTFDLLIYPHQMEQASRLVATFPGQKFVLDHMAKPPVGSGELQPWKRKLEQLAAFPNVWCKISGLVTEAGPSGWSHDALVPYLEAAVHAFGVERIMVGSDWPVCLLAAEYAEVMAIPRRYFDGWSNEEKLKIFYQNAISFYELDA